MATSKTPSRRRPARDPATAAAAAPVNTAGATPQATPAAAARKSAARKSAAPSPAKPGNAAPAKPPAKAPAKTSAKPPKAAADPAAPAVKAAATKTPARKGAARPKAAPAPAAVAEAAVPTAPAAPQAAARKSAARKVAAKPAQANPPAAAPVPAKKTAAKKAATKQPSAKKAAAGKASAVRTPAAGGEAPVAPAAAPATAPAAAAKSGGLPPAPTTRRRGAPRPAAQPNAEVQAEPTVPVPQAEPATAAEAEVEVEALIPAPADEPVAAPVEAAVEASAGPVAEPAAEPSDVGDDDGPAEPADTVESATATPRKRSRSRRRGKGGAAARAAAAGADHAADSARATDADDATDALATTPAEPVPEPPPPPTGPADSALVLVDGDQRRIAWQPGHACPAALRDDARGRVDADGFLPPEDDAALPRWQRLAADAGHRLDVDPALWPLWAACRDMRIRAQRLEAAYPDGPSSPGLAQLLRAPLAPFQAEGALFAAVAGRALIADQRGLGKTVQAIAAAELFCRHFGVQRVAVLCAPAQRTAWQRAWLRFAGRTAQVVEGGAHQRQALWAAEAELRILSPDASGDGGAGGDASQFADWAPELVIIDEPQRLPGWQAFDAPQVLVLCGAPLDEQPGLLDTLVAWLDTARLGPLAALRRVQLAHDRGERLDDDTIEQLSDALSRLVLQRQRAEVADQLPVRIHSLRSVALAPAQREAHDRHRASLQRLLAGWQRSGYLADADQWRLAQALRDAQAACQRGDPSSADSALGEALLTAVATQLQDWADTGRPAAALCCADEDQRALFAERVAPAYPGLALVGPDELPPAGTEVVLRVGVPWKPARDRQDDADTPRGQQWVYLVGQDSLEQGLAETLHARADAPRGPGEGGRGYLAGSRLVDWLQAVALALQAVTPQG